MHEQDRVIRELLEGTAAHTGPDFFRELVRHVTRAMDVAGCWVTELSPDRRHLRALAFWFQDRYIPDYQYAIEGTPCEPVIDQCTLFHVPENVINLFPRDPDLASFNAVSYLGLPVVDASGAVIGHLAALDVRPLHLSPRLDAIFRIFGARAGAEIERLRSENRLREREQQLSSVLDSTSEAILVIDEQQVIRHANRCGRERFDITDGDRFSDFLSDASASRWRQEAALLLPARQGWWIGEIDIRRPDGVLAAAEVSISPFERDGQWFWTLVLRDLQEQREAERRLNALQVELEDLRPVGQLIGESAPMRAVFGQIRQVAQTAATVLIHGETGTGKELVARAIHEGSSRRGKPMIRVNCGAIPAALIESEFFGHEKGAFTGATDRREGRFALADGGTLFLDEIGELPLDLQVKLLRVLQEGEFEPVGGSRTRKVDVRIIAATHRDLRAESERGRFRADLYYRLNVFPLELPPLRERGDDIILLAEAFTERLSAKLNRRFGRLSREVRETLRRHTWPGNVRELENALERSAILSRTSELVLDPRLFPEPQAAAPPQALDPPRNGEDQVLTARQLESLERANLIRALERCAWRVAGETGAAKLLGVAPSTLSSRMKALGVTRPARGIS